MSRARPAHPPQLSLDQIAAELAVSALEPAQAPLTGLALASGQVQPGDLFVALAGANTHGASYAGAALAAGAAAVWTDPAGAALLPPGTPQVVTANPRAQLGGLAAWFYGHPAQHLKLAGVTGTTGKTSVSYLIEAAMAAAWPRTALLGTIEMRIAGVTSPQTRTTLEAPDLQAAFAAMVEADVTGCALEISSHALALGRVNGFTVDVAAFTNLSRDHLDYHRDLEAYFAAKAQLFTPAQAEFGVIVADDTWGQRLAATAPIELITVGRRGDLDWQIEPRGIVLDGGTPAQAFALTNRRGQVLFGQTRLVGGFNLTNAAVALLTAVQLGIDPATAASGIASLAAIPGRMEQISRSGDRTPLAVVDFAHTADQIEAVCTALRHATTGRLILVIGAGGGRDQGKRPEMGAVASYGGDLVVITDDNPRDEAAASIRAQIRSGATGPAEVIEVSGRGQAIRAAVARAAIDDTIVVAGKGHETSQEIAGQMQPWDDRVELAAALKEHGPWD